MKGSRRGFVVMGIVVVAAALIALPLTRDAAARMERERSDRFWSALHVGGVRERYPSLEALVDSVDGVIIARIVSIGEGSENRDLEAEASGMDRQLSSVFFIRSTIRVESVLAGSLPGPGNVIDVEQLGDWSLVPKYQGKLPTERTLMFLTDKAVYDPALRGVYEPIRTLREIDGTILPVDPDESFLQEAAGRGFDDFTEDLRSLFASSR